MAESREEVKTVGTKNGRGDLNYQVDEGSMWRK